MSLKDVVASDIDNVFFVADDLAEPHTVNGVSCMCVVDDDRLLERTDAAAVGTFLGEKLLFVKAALLRGRPAANARFELDGKTWYVRSCTENTGVYEIRLTANKP